ncbi:hypothetical protein BACCIP111895_00182 [Neobacillus rhizosphaerae]|uniref:DUF4272 domain-containing protein n=1 Tax=Neobacillus rhizosphaerae TaxID=2880965 RepID=A0ABN8KHY3_9BACI|nr:DUF4272 domain-containing protein [Neobacillus rhizosphaerae]CAH2713049.1 hypothetical protein BACCIP111895_00182 [Neobacillus rhizosphaerae]
MELNFFIERVTIMAGMVYIAHQAPPSAIKRWIEEQGLFQNVTEFEKDILEKSEIEVTPTEIMRLKWYVESLWALVWVLGINNNFRINEPVGDNLIQMVPDVRKKQDFSTLVARTFMRSEKKIYEQVDLFYRLHWYLVDARLNGKKHNKLDEGTIMERRKALEWVVTPGEEWDEIDLST